jgi:hypothetical protein
MPRFRFPPDPTRPVPRAAVDQITRRDEALAVIALAVTQPLIDETIVLVLDDHRRGSVITAVTGTHDADDLLRVVDIFAAASELRPCSHLVLASVRPARPAGPDDIDRWEHVSNRAVQHGIIVDEWFIIDPEGATSMRSRQRCEPGRRTGSAVPAVAPDVSNSTGERTD